MNTTAVTNPIAGFDNQAFINFILDPDDTASVFKIQSTIIGAPNRQEMIQWTVKALTADESFMGLYNEKYNPPFPMNDELMAYPEGSLGRTVAAYLLANDISLDFAGLDTSVFYQQDVTPMAYLGSRMIRTHDVYHTIFNLSTSALDEHKLLAFQISQLASPYHMTLLSSGFIRMAFYEPENIRSFLAGIARYFEIGKSANFFPGFPFEKHWATPISEVRELLNVKI